MATIERTVAAGVFTTFEQAETAVENLRSADFPATSIGFASRDARSAPEEAADTERTYATEGLLAGLTTGAGAGALWALGITAGVLPVLGPAIAAGTLAAVLSSAAAGAAVVGIAGMLAGLGLSREEADFYESEVNQGRVLVTVDLPGRTDEALQIMRASGAYDYQTRSKTIVGS